MPFDQLPRLDRLRARWDGLVSISDASTTGLDAGMADAPSGEAILVRPDGFVGWRSHTVVDDPPEALARAMSTLLMRDRVAA